MVMPGDINAHGHLYAALAAGMPLPRTPLTTFTDILTEIWWKLDRALDAEAISRMIRQPAICQPLSGRIKRRLGQ